MGLIMMMNGGAGIQRVVLKNAIKYSNLCKYIQTNSKKCERVMVWQPLNIQIPVLQANYYKLIFLMESQRKTSKQEAEAKKKKHGDPRDDSDGKGSDSDGNGSGNSQEMESFVVGDDYEESYDDEDYDSENNNKKKKKDKKKKKKKKKKNRGDSDDSMIADDLEVVDAAEGDFKRLKKNRDKVRRDNQDEYDEDDVEEEEDYEMGPEVGEQYSDDVRPDYDEESYQSEYQNKRYQQADLNDLLDERVRKQFFAETTDKEIVDMDLPQRQIIKYKNYARIYDNQIEVIQKSFESEQRATEARWIYKRLRQMDKMDKLESQDEKECRFKIQNVLLAMHREHLDIMYIYYYRKKIWAGSLDLGLLIKIEEIDEEWMTFKKEYKALEDDIVNVIPSFQEVPRSLAESLTECTDIRQLKYFKDYTSFVMAKIKSDVVSRPANKKLSIIRQICESGMDTWVSDKQPFLSPHNYCVNIRNRTQDKKPYTPSSPPDKVLRRLVLEKKLDNANPNEMRRDDRESTIMDEKQEEIEDKKRDWSATPLLAPEKRITTLINYLAIELYNYPEMRKILKQKYYKKLLMSTYPTNQGAHHINIYNSFFPVKRIKDKPVTTMKKQLWILAKEAQRLGLITIELKFEWQLSATDRKNFDGDPVYSELVKYYFDLSSQYTGGESWNLLRKQVLVRLLADNFLPVFIEEVKEDLMREGSREIIESCCQKFRTQLNIAPSLREGEPIKALAMVLEQQKLGLAFVDEQGKEHSPMSIELRTDDELKRFVSDEILSKLIDEHNPDMILVAANCRRAQTLRKELRNPSLFRQQIYCEFGEYEVPSLMANKNIIQGIASEKCILEAISMARLKKNPMAEILGLWSDNIEENAVYSMNLHPLQKFVNKRKLIDALQRVAVEIVNLVGVDIDDIRNSDHCRNILQFVSGLGPRKAFDLIEKVKEKYPPTRKHLLEIVRGNYVYTNCSPFIKFERPEHLEMIEKLKSGTLRQQFKKQKQSKHKSKESGDKNELNLLDMTRIPEEWYQLTQRLFLHTIKAGNMLELKHKKSANHLTEEQLSVREMFKHPEKLKNVEWESRKDENRFYDEGLVKGEIMFPFRDPREQEKVKENKEIFYSLIKESPETLKKYMVVTVRVLSVNQQYLNVVIPENGLFGYIKLPSDKGYDRGNNFKPVKYEKGMFIKAVITGFPSFDDKRHRQRQEGEQEQELLKVDMALSFPHRSEEKGHDCHKLCFPSILKEIHPNIDLDKENFDLNKESMPVVEIKEEQAMRPKTEFKRISHPKFKNVNMQTAVDEVKDMKIGEYIIRPSTEGANFLTITWNFYKGVVGHIKLKCEQRPENPALYTYRVLDKARDKVYSSIDEIIQRYLKPMNALVQDVISNKKFLSNPLEQVEEKVKLEAAREQSYIQYFFCCSVEYPQFFVLVYMYKDKKPIKELIRVKNDGLYFHDQVFRSLRELISFFKEHLKDKKYQAFVKATALKK